MTPFISASIHFISAGVLVFDILIVAGIIALFVPGFRASSVFKMIGSKAILLAFLVSFGATLGSFFFSDYIGFAPCLLCWYQRIAIFPQVVLFAVALYKKDDRVIEYSLVLSIVGSLIAAYHYYGQMFNVNALPCAAEAVSCAKREFIEFGYITIPIMSLTTLLTLIVLMVYRRLYLRSVSI